MLDEILPSCVAVVEAFDDEGDAVLFPEEEAVVSRAIDRRRREFATVRACARRALVQLSVAPGPILTGPAGAPVWPAGIVGSMSHCAGYRASAVARSTDLISLGIDAEEHAPLPPGVLDHVSLPVERDAISRQSRIHPDICWDRLLFSAKESVYKAWFPLTRRWLGFDQAVVSVNLATRTFYAQILPAGQETAHPALGGFHGRWLIGNGLVLTAVACRPRPGTAPSAAAETWTPPTG